VLLPPVASGVTAGRRKARTAHAAVEAGRGHKVVTITRRGPVA
jgi:hypothetical protein